MKKYFQIIISAIFLCCTFGTTEKCCSDSRCNCVALRNNTYEAQCVSLGLTSATFPRFYNNVESVVLNHNKIRVLPHPLYEYLPETIERIEIAYNEIQYLKNYSFLLFNNLTKLNLRQNQLRYIEKGTFSPLSSLENLNLYGNKYLTFRVLRNTSYDLQFTDIRVLRLDGLHCAGGINTMIFVSDVEFLANTSLQELYLTYNRLGYFEKGALSILPKTIAKMDLSYNIFMFGPWLFELQSLTGLTSLNAGYRLTYGGLPALINCHDWRSPNSQKLHVTEMKQVSWSQIFSNFLPPNLKEFYFVQAQAWTTRLEGSRLSGNNALEIIDVRNNYFEGWDGPVKNLHKLKYLDMSNVGGKTVSNDFFSDTPLLQTLKINNNSLGPVIEADEEGRFFQHLKALHVLEISNNVINTLPMKVFKNLFSLESLRLSWNYITDWKISIAHMKNLTLLDLSSNRLSYFSLQTMEDIDNHLSKERFKVNLNDNVLRCTCDTLRFMMWVLINSEMFIDFSSYHCLDEKKNKITFENVKEKVDDLKKRCTDHTGLIFGVGMAIATVVFAIIAGYVYRYRWKLRYMYYLGPLKFRKTQNQEPSNYDFDAFISYSSENDEEVRKIVETVEGRHNLSLQLHQRDFIAGKSIPENITETIHKCRKTVIMLSPDFLKSYWCMYEFNIAHMESVTSRGDDDSIIIVVLKPVKKRDLPLVMSSIMEFNSYVEYPNSEEEECAFIDKVQRAIKGT